MDQGRGPGIAQDDTSLLQHVGGQFGYRDAVAKGDHIAQPNSYLVRALTSHSHESRDAVRTRSSVERAYEWSIVDRQPVPIKRPLPSSIVRHNGQADSTSKGSEIGITPAQRWQSEAVKAEPWNGLGQVSSYGNATTKAAQASKMRKSWSMEPHKNNSSRGNSSNHSGRTSYP
jgi:hypothetical protein